MRMSRFLLLFIICFYALCVNAQTSNNTFKVPEIIPKSPEAASLGRYGEVPVGEYTGAANISVPLHVVKGGKLEFPINLYYNSTGIRVAQDATWVGLGWDLSAVGGITYVPVAGNDQTYTMYTPWRDVKRLIDYINPAKLYPLVGHEDHPMICGGGFATPDGWEPQVLQNALGLVSGAKGAVDLFNVNCMGMSFKFYIHPETNQAKVFGDKNNYKIEIINGNINVGFRITDNNGVIYTFNVLEYSYGNPTRIINSWYVSEIRRPDGDWLKFKYANFGTINPIPSYTQQYAHAGASMTVLETMGYRARSFTGNSVENQYLTEIESSTELVQFNLSNNRLDIYGAGARRLESIEVTDKFSARRKSFSFEYSYFDGSTVGGNYLGYYTNAPITFSEDQLKKRLKLVSVTERDAGGKENKRHGFSYNEETPLPYKTSSAIDHWGFYNGQNNQTLIPKLFSLFQYDPAAKHLLGGADQFYGGNRGCSKDFVTAATLKSITWPTGGKSNFIFEPNSFPGSVFSAEEEVRYADNLVSYTSYDFNTTSNTPSFTLDRETLVDFMGHINNINYLGGYHDCSKMLGTSIVLFCAAGNCTTNTTWTINCGDFDQTGKLSKTWNQQILLPAGTYALISTLPDALGFVGYSALVTATIKFRDQKIPEQVVANHTESYGEGLRIKKVDNYAAGNSLTSSREYKYIKENGAGSGILIAPLRYTNIASFNEGDVTFAGDVWSPARCSIIPNTAIVLNSNNNAVLPTSPFRANLGYSRVEVIDKDENDVASNGKVVKTFRNEVTNSFFDGIELFGVFYPQNNGSVLSTTYLSTSGNKVREEVFDYDNILVDKDWINVKAKDHYAGSADCSCQEPFYSVDYRYRYVFATYPYVNYKTVLAKKTEVDYTPTGNLTTQTDYEYNVTNYEVSKIKTTNSKGGLNVTTVKYADDLRGVSSLYGLMVDANMVSAPVETIKYKGETEQLERMSTNYGLVDNFYIEPVSVERQLKASSPANLIYYNKYSEGGNIAEYKAANGIYISTIWGYGNTLPVAHVENAQFYNIFYTGFEEGDGNSAGNDSKTGLKSHIGAYSKQLTGLANGNYVFSYWLKSGTTWVLYSQTVTVTSGSYTINFTNGQQVDDIRFHPANSYMKTFTYEPISGITSATDINNSTIYYEYDNFGRLIIVRDNDKNILKKICYNYQGQPASCSPGIGNVEKTGTFTRNNCGSGDSGGTITYTVAANSYFAATQQEADALAQNDVDANGQAYANKKGSCLFTFFNEAKSGTFTRNNCSLGAVPGSVTYTVPADVYSSTISQEVADQLAQDDVNANGQTYANNNGTCTWYSIAKSGTFTRNNCQGGAPGSTVIYTVEAGMYSSTVSQAAADQLAQNDVDNNGQTYANTNGVCPEPCSISVASAYFNVANGVSSNGTTVTLGMAFFSYTPMAVNVPYVIGTINGSCRPSASRTVNFNSNSRLWTLVINTNGQMTLYMANGTTLSPQNVIATGTLTFNL